MINSALQLQNRFYNRADNTNITGIADGLIPANDETYTYTDAGRLAGATSSTTASYGTRSWTYDANGNRLTETANGTLQNYYYPANNNRLSNVAQGSVSKRIFTYDAAGNVTQDYRDNTNAYNYTINNAGRIRQMSLNTGTAVSTYTYDGFQRLRIKAQTAPVSTTHYIWDSFGHIIAEHASAGGVQKEYIWLGDTPLALFEGANLYYVHPDNLDRPVMMTNNNAAQSIAWAARYDPFGKAVTVTSAITNNQRLPGQWFQIEDGLAYNWHRTYDPSIGRYTQADPLGFVDGPSVYGYAGQSPVMRVDPKGLDTPTMGPYGPFWTSTVMVCERPAEILFGSFPHKWILTSNQSIGMGADPNVPPGTQYDPPYSTRVFQNDHSKDNPSKCTTVRNIDTACVSKKLKEGEPLGRFGPIGNNCHDFVANTLRGCRK